MKRFHFRLEKVLGIKKHHEKEWELKLAKATGECIRIENTIQHNLYEKARTLSTRRLSGEIMMEKLYSSELYMQRLTQHNRNLEQELVQKELERESIQKGYLEASKERKVLDKLKEKQENGFYAKQRVEEMKEIDDMNNSMYVQRQEIEQGG